MRTYTLPPLHPGQREVRDAEARHRVVYAGRRWGKTRLAVAECYAVALAGGQALWAAPTNPLTDEGWEVAQKLADAIPEAEIRLGDKRINLPGGGWMQAKSAESKGGLRSRGWDLVVFEECAFGESKTWHRELRPSLSDRKGRALFITSPNGENWVYDLFERVQSGALADWAAFRFRTGDNPLIDPAEIEAARAELPADDFAQEYEAVPTSRKGRIFQRADVDAMAEGGAGLAGPVDGGNYWHAWDLGRKRDASCGITARYDGEPFQVVAFESEVGLPWVETQDRIEQRQRRYGGRTAVEVTGVGDVVAGNLAVHVTEFHTTAANKAKAIQAARLLVERGAIKCGEPQLLRALRAAGWSDSHYADELMAFAILAYHLPRPRRSTLTKRTTADEAAADAEVRRRVQAAEAAGQLVAPVVDWENLEL